MNKCISKENLKTYDKLIKDYIDLKIKEAISKLDANKL